MANTFPLDDNGRPLALQAQLAGILSVSAAAGMQVQPTFNYSYMSTSGGNQLLKTGPGVLHSVVVGVSSTTSSMQFYDNTTSATANTIGYIVSATGRNTFIYDAKFNTGLTVSVGSILDTITITYL